MKILITVLVLAAIAYGGTELSKQLIATEQARRNSPEYKQQVIDQAVFHDYLQRHPSFQ